MSVNSSSEPVAGVVSPLAASSLGALYADESASIQQAFESSGDGLAAIRARSDLVDRVVKRLHETFFPSSVPGGPDNFCLVAVGGYGRRELYPHSDVDLVFLAAQARVHDAYREEVAAFSRTLWDTGMRVGGGPRSLAECREIHRDNLEFTVSLLDARHIAGDVQLFHRLHSEVVPHVIARDGDDLIRDLVEMTRRRHEKQGGTIFHLEPNLKETPGGLRDYHVARWLALIAELDARGRWVAPEDQWPAALRAPSSRAFEFLSALRCFLHQQRGRDDNLLTYELQEQAAAQGIGHARGSVPSALPPATEGGNGQSAPGAWMRDYFRHVRFIDRLVTQSVSTSITSRRSLYGLFQDWRSRLSNADFSVVRGRIFPRQPEATLEDPTLLLSLFEMIARHDLELSQEAELWIEARILRVADWARRQPGTLWQRFRPILCLPHAAAALRAMHRLGLLVAIFPEFRAIDALVVRDFYHRYTVDEHSFMTIQNLHVLGPASGKLPLAPQADRREAWERRFAEILHEIEEMELLLLALLFHDVGKGTHQGDHVRGSLEAAESVCTRLGLAPEGSETVRFLIANHLEMSATLQRRDIFDPETVGALAKKIGTPERLKLLSLFTYADIQAVNPDALTPWKAQMLWQLYAAAANFLSRSVDEERLHAAEGRISKAEQALPLLGAGAAAPQLQVFLEGFPRRYLETHTPEEIAAHFELARRLAEKEVQIILRPQPHFCELTVVTHDRPFLFASITGTLAAWGMNILKADAFANQAGIVLDTFRFADLHRTLELNPSEAERLEKSVVEVLTGEMSLEALMKGRVRAETSQRTKVEIRTQVRFDETSSSHSTLLELITWDRPGLLYQVSSRLAELGCNIEVALIDTEGQKVIDVFYLTSEGTKLTTREQERIRTALLEQI
jgi:[protein-PII] uridylyltransferase